MPSVFADATCEDEGVDSAHECDESAGVLGEGRDEFIECEFGVRVFGFGECADVGRESMRESEES